MSGINAGSSTGPIQRSPSPSQESEPARLVIRTANEARDHWNMITTSSQASDAMAHLSEQVEGGHIDEESYRVLANTLGDMHNRLQTREAAQAERAHLPARPPLSGPSDLSETLHQLRGQVLPNNPAPTRISGPMARQVVPDPENPGQMITRNALRLRQRRDE
jgi:hypothetical protein